MPSIRKVASRINQVNMTAKTINWYPGHMFSGMKAMIGKLNTVDCVIEVHDARIPFIGRNIEFRKHLGYIKPHILALNKSDLADLTNWSLIEEKLAQNGDRNVLLTDLSGSEFSVATRGYTSLLDLAVKLIRESDRFNRSTSSSYKVMVVGIPNVGKSTLINRLRQHHLGLAGEATRTGNIAGITRKVENMVKICSRPLIYSIDTPGVLQPSDTKNFNKAMKLSLCSTLSDKVVKSYELAGFLLDHLNRDNELIYHDALNIKSPVANLQELCTTIAIQHYPKFQQKKSLGEITDNIDTERVCWYFVNQFRRGAFGKVMFM